MWSQPVKSGNNTCSMRCLWNRPYVCNPKKKLAPRLRVVRPSICSCSEMSTSVCFSFSLKLICESAQNFSPKLPEQFWSSVPVEEMTQSHARVRFHLLAALYSGGSPFDTSRWHVSSKAGPSHLFSLRELQVIHVLLRPKHERKTPFSLCSNPEKKTLTFVLRRAIKSRNWCLFLSEWTAVGFIWVGRS